MYLLSWNRAYGSMCQLHSIAAHFFFSALPAADTAAMQNKLQHKTCRISSSQPCLRRYHRRSSSRSLHRPELIITPIILNGTEAALHCTARSACVCHPINRCVVPTFLSGELPTTTRKQAPKKGHAPCRRRGGGRGNLRGRAWLSFADVRTSTMVGESPRAAARPLVFLVGAFSRVCCWRGSPHHRLPWLKFRVSLVSRASHIKGPQYCLFGVIRFSSSSHQ